LLGENGALLYRDLVLAGTGEVFERGTRLTPEAYAEVRAAGIRSLPIAPGNLLARAGDELSAELVGRLQRAGFDEVHLYRPRTHSGTTVRATLAKDPTRGTLDALFAIHNLLRPGTAPAPEVWTEEDFVASAGQIVHVHDFLQMWQEAEENATDNGRESQRSTEDRMIRFAQERGIRYVWEN